MKKPERKSPHSNQDFFVDGLSATNSTYLEMPVVGITGIEIYRTITETPVDFLRGDNTCGTDDLSDFMTEAELEEQSGG